MGSVKMTPTEVLEVALFQTALYLATTEAAGLNCVQTKMSGRMEEYRAGSYKARIPPEIDFHTKTGWNPEEVSVGESFQNRDTN